MDEWVFLGDSDGDTVSNLDGCASASDDGEISFTGNLDADGANSSPLQIPLAAAADQLPPPLEFFTFKGASSDEAPDLTPAGRMETVPPPSSPEAISAPDAAPLPDLIGGGGEKKGAQAELPAWWEFVAGKHESSEEAPHLTPAAAAGRTETVPPPSSPKAIWPPVAAPIRELFVFRAGENKDAQIPSGAKPKAITSDAEQKLPAITSDAEQKLPAWEFVLGGKYEEAERRAAEKIPAAREFVLGGKYEEAERRAAEKLPAAWEFVLGGEYEEAERRAAEKLPAAWEFVLGDEYEEAERRAAEKLPAVWEFVLGDEYEEAERRAAEKLPVAWEFVVGGKYEELPASWEFVLGGKYEEAERRAAEKLLATWEFVLGGEYEEAERRAAEKLPVAWESVLGGEYEEAERRAAEKLPAAWEFVLGGEYEEAERRAAEKLPAAWEFVLGGEYEEAEMQSSHATESVFGRDAETKYTVRDAKEGTPRAFAIAADKVKAAVQTPRPVPPPPPSVPVTQREEKTKRAALEKGEETAAVAAATATGENLKPKAPSKQHSRQERADMVDLSVAYLVFASCVVLQTFFLTSVFLY